MNPKARTVIEFVVLKDRILPSKVATIGVKALSRRGTHTNVMDFIPAKDVIMGRMANNKSTATGRTVEIGTVFDLVIRNGNMMIISIFDIGNIDRRGHGDRIQHKAIKGNIAPRGTPTKNKKPDAIGFTLGPIRSQDSSMLDF